MRSRLGPRPPAGDFAFKVATTISETLQLSLVVLMHSVQQCIAQISWSTLAQLERSQDFPLKDEGDGGGRARAARALT
jgi:hypothetical protein